MNQPPVKNRLTWILLSGLLVGTLDIVSACVDYYVATGKGPEGVLRFVASGVFGQQAFTGNDTMLIWGLLFHYVIAFSFTIFFFWLYPKVEFIRVNPLLSALLYGIFMWVVTTRIIMPLSHTPKGSFQFWKAVKAILILVVMIGVPLSFIARSYFNKWMVKA
jgi:hypothetical protein